MEKLNTDIFVAKSKLIHGNKYDYSMVIYVNSGAKVIIQCPLHGQFLQIPDNHIHRKSGCPKCKAESTHLRCNKGVDKFVLESKKIHDNKYDYHKVNYVNAHTKVEILCLKHGSFFQSPNQHLMGNGCPKCATNTKTTEEFIREANIVHEGLYEYIGVSYIDLVTKIPIKCKVHGTFYQIPNAHLKGQGCPKCKKSKGEVAISKFLEQHNIIYESPKTFYTCINPKTGWNLYYDFYLSNKNILIEFDGYQHYLPYYRDKHNLDSLKMRKYRDRLKNIWAKENGYILVRIPYTSIKKIPEILEKKLDM